MSYPRWRPNPVDLVQLATDYHIDYWRLWTEKARYHHHTDHRQSGPMPHVVPLHPIRRYLQRSDRILRKRGYVPWATAERICERAGTHPAIVYGPRWHAIEALLAEGAIR